MSRPLDKQLRILLIRQDKLGDLLLTTPVFRAIKEAHPDSHLTVWIQSGLKEVVINNPYIDRIEFTEMHPKFLEGVKLTIRMVLGRYSIVIFPKNRAGVHIPASWAARIPRRIGSVTKKYKRYLTQNIERNWDEFWDHESEWAYQVCEAALQTELHRHPLEMHLSEASKSAATALLTERGVECPFFIVHVATGGTSNAWFPEQYGVVAREVMARTGWQAVFSGIDSEGGLVQRAMAECPGAVSIVGKTDLPHFAAVLKQASLMITANTGAMHLAATQQVPIVMVEPTPDVQKNWIKFRPWKCQAVLAGANVMCEGCTATHCHREGRACNDSISVDTVVRSALELVENKVDRGRFTPA